MRTRSVTVGLFKKRFSVSSGTLFCLKGTGKERERNGKGAEKERERNSCATAHSFSQNRYRSFNRSVFSGQNRNRSFRPWVKTRPILLYRPILKIISDHKCCLFPNYQAFLPKNLVLKSENRLQQFDFHSMEVYN